MTQALGQVMETYKELPLARHRAFKSMKQAVQIGHMLGKYSWSSAKTFLGDESIRKKGQHLDPETVVTSASKIISSGIDDLLLACLDQAICFLDPPRA